MNRINWIRKKEESLQFLLSFQSNLKIKITFRQKWTYVRILSNDGVYTYVYTGVEERRPRKVIEEKGWGKKVVWISAFEWRVHSLSFPVCCFKEEIQGYLILDVFFRVADSTLSRFAKTNNPPMGRGIMECVSTLKNNLRSEIWIWGFIVWLQRAHGDSHSSVRRV